MMIKKIIICSFLFLVFVSVFSVPPDENLEPIVVKTFHFDTLEYTKNLELLIKAFNFCLTDTSGVYDRVVDDYANNQHPASFPGGDTALHRYLSYNTRYPHFSRENGIQGKVIVKFIINEYGGICNVQILRIGGYGLPEEAIRILKTLPKWMPAIIKGKAVKSYCILPINFKIANKIIHIK